MKIRLTIIVLAISLLTNGILFYLCWTAQTDTTPIFDPFEINYSVTENSLIKDGYTPIPEDVPLLGKQVGDTLIYYQLDYECSDATDIKDIDCKNTGIYGRNCVIYLDKVDSMEMSRLADKYDAEILGEFKMQRSFYDSNFLRADFYIRHKFTQAIFDCSIDKSYRDDKKDKYELSIQTLFPLTKERVKTELEDRQVGNEYHKFNEVLGMGKKDADEFLLSNVERIVLMDDHEDKGVDSVQYVFETTKHTYTLSFVNDTVKYISVTFGTTTVGLMDNISSTFGQDSLYDIKDDFLNNRINKPYSTAKLFADKEKGFNYLVIVENDPQYSAQPSTMIIWRKNKK
ncbi:hypothetical protein [Chryseolinea sp. H1M3-3]|uniref:hypothetical protein n=1 Tax=Chryseolinea sp. H1M3-3 TaxID=3034144 RepID=UPI0023ED8209|nr:hypothetical protein [Chryseolinea sp. H1M3-3]